MEHKYTPTIGRSHGIHAEPTTFGVKLAQAYAEFDRCKARLVAANELHGMLADYDAITPGTMESIRTYIPFAPGTIQHPNGNASNFSGTMLTGRRTIVSPQIDTTVTGTTLNLGSGATGVRFSASASGTTVLRIYGISCRESRW